MGHYWSEMRNPGPQELYQGAVEIGRKELGFRSLKIEYTQLYVCDGCDCLVTNPGKHMEHCPTIGHWMTFQHDLELASIELQKLTEPTERNKFLQAMCAQGTNAYAVEVAFETARVAQTITIEWGDILEYKDDVIGPVAQTTDTDQEGSHA